MVEAPANKGKAGRAVLVAEVTAKEHVKQFPTELYEDSDILFCYCDHSLDFVSCLDKFPNYHSRGTF